MAPELATNKFGHLDGIEMTDEQLAAEITRRLDVLRGQPVARRPDDVRADDVRVVDEVPAINSDPTLVLSRRARPASAEAALLAVPVAHTAGDKHQPTDRQLGGRQASNDQYWPVTIPEDYLGQEHRVHGPGDRTCVAQPPSPGARRGKPSYLLLAAVMAAGIAIPGSWNVVSQLQDIMGGGAGTGVATVSDATAPTVLPNRVMPGRAISVPVQNFAQGQPVLLPANDIQQAPPIAAVVVAERIPQVIPEEMPIPVAAPTLSLPAVKLKANSLKENGALKTKTTRAANSTSATTMKSKPFEPLPATPKPFSPSGALPASTPASNPASPPASTSNAWLKVKPFVPTSP